MERARGRVVGNEVKEIMQKAGHEGQWDLVRTTAPTPMTRRANGAFDQGPDTF